jgi:hypothetical protein
MPFAGVPGCHSGLSAEKNLLRRRMSVKKCIPWIYALGLLALVVGLLVLVASDNPAPSTDRSRGELPVTTVDSEPPMRKPAFDIWQVRSLLNDSAQADAIKRGFSTLATIRYTAQVHVALNLRMPSSWKDLLENSFLRWSDGAFFNGFKNRPVRFLDSGHAHEAEIGDFVWLGKDSSDGGVRIYLVLPGVDGNPWKATYSLTSDRLLAMERASVDNPSASSADPRGIIPAVPGSSFLNANAQWARKLPTPDKEMVALCSALRWMFSETNKKRNQRDYAFLSDLPRPVRSLNDLRQWWPVVNLDILAHPWTGQPLNEVSYETAGPGDIVIVTLTKAEYTLPVCFGKEGRILNYGQASIVMRSLGKEIPSAPPGWDPPLMGTPR